MEALKSFINHVTRPQTLFPFLLLFTIVMFPANDFLFNINKKLKLYKLWTRRGGIVLFSFILAFFAFGLTDPNFRKNVTKPDNVPIVGLLFLVNFFLWFSMKQAYENDALTEQGKEPTEPADAKEKVLVWPDLVYIEFIALILCTVLLFIWSIFLKAPIEEPANPTVSPNPSTRPTAPASAPSVHWAASSLHRPTRGWRWRTSSSPRCRDKGPFQNRRCRSRISRRRHDRARRAATSPDRDRRSRSSPIGLRSRNHGRPAPCTRGIRSGSSWAWMRSCAARACPRAPVR